MIILLKRSYRFKDKWETGSKIIIVIGLLIVTISAAAISTISIY